MGVSEIRVKMIRVKVFSLTLESEKMVWPMDPKLSNSGAQDRICN